MTQAFWGGKLLGGYAGLKHTANKIAEFIPPCKLYVEPFCGLASVSKYVKADKIILNDISLPIKIFACGPHGMLKAIYDYSIKNNYDCQLALETIMACGIGICQGCTIEKKCEDDLHSYRNKYALACIDGPVFNIEELSNAF